MKLPSGRNAFMSRAGLLTLVLVALAAVSLKKSQRHLVPIFDEVSFLDLARDVKDSGGIVKNIQDHLRGVNREDARNPLYLYAYSLLIDGTPRDFPRGKLLTLFFCLALLASAYPVVERACGPGAGLLFCALFGLSPSFADLSHQLIADILFSLFYMHCLFKLLDDRSGWGKWAACGALAGLAFLTKSTGYFLLFNILWVGVWEEGVSFLKSKKSFAAVTSFIGVGFFLLYRNLIVWKNPLHHFNDKIIWLDRWPDYFVLSEKADVWSRFGFLEYVKSHSVPEMGSRLVDGMAHTLVMLIQNFSLLSPRSAAGLFSGAFLLGLALMGVRDSWKKGDKKELVVFGPLTLLLFLAFSYHAVLAGNFTRYTLPMALSFFPFLWRTLNRGFVAAERLLANRIGRRVPLVEMIVFLWAGSVFLTSMGSLSKNPMDFWGVPDFWSRTSHWIAANREGRKILSPHDSRYSSWDAGRYHQKAYPYSQPSSDIKSVMKAHGIEHALVDMTVATEAIAREKFGPTDAEGPVTFMGMPRCFSSGGGPSVFLIFSDNC